MQLKWGIASAGRISHDFVNALSTVPENEQKVIAIAARNEEDAKKFAEKHEIPKFYQGYDNLANDSEIDIIYIGTLNPQHYEVAKLMLDHGKHVLCEKPLCMNEKQARAILAYAKEKKLFFMEGMWARYFPTYQLLKQRIDNGDLGEIKKVTGTMIIPMGVNDRLQKKSHGGGTVIDMGVYIISAALWCYREYPQSIKATADLNEECVDTGFKAELTFSGNGKAFMETGTTYHHEHNDLVVTGTKGTITIHQLWSPIKLTDIDGTVKEFPLPKARHDFVYWNSCGLRYEAIAVREAIISGKLEEDQMPHTTSIQFAQIEDEIRRQIGVHHYEDDQEF